MAPAPAPVTVLPGHPVTSSCPEQKQPRSEAQREASRRNGAKGHGPATAEGKARVARNATRHGMTGAGVALPDDLAREVAERLAALAAELAPRDDAERALVATLALAAARRDRLAWAEDRRARDRMRTALEDWDAARAAEVDGWLAHLDPADDSIEKPAPAAALKALQRTAEGCDALVDAWTALADRLERFGTWDAADAARVARLFGRLDPEPRPRDLDPWWAEFAAERALLEAAAAPDAPEELRAEADAARAELLELAREQAAALAARAEERWEQFDAPDRAGAPERAGFDPTPEGTRLMRYLAAAERAHARALADLARRRAADPAPAPVPVPHAAPAVPPAPRPAPAPAPTPTRRQSNPAPAPPPLSREDLAAFEALFHPDHATFVPVSAGRR